MLPDHHLTVLRAVHRRFADADPELPNGFAEHTTMGVDALLHLGCAPAAVTAWADRHDPAPLEAASPTAWRRDDLLARIDAEGWPNVVAEEVAALAPTVGAHLFHGLIRTAHAVRTIASADEDWSRRELSIALAAWSVWAGPTSDRRDDASPIPHTPVDAARDVVLDAARRGAAAFVASPSIPNLHAVTGPMAFALLADHVDETTLAAAAAAFGRTHARHPAAGPIAPVAPPSRSELDALALRWDAHPAKLVEAALRGHDATGDPVFLAAAAAMAR